MADPLLQFVTRGVFVLVFCLTLLDFLRWRDLPHLEVAALFSGFLLVIGLQVVTDLTAIAPPSWATNAALLAFLAQPYLLLRFLGQFRPVPRPQLAVATVGLVLSWGILVAFSSEELPSWGMLVVVGAFTYVEGYATLEFVRTALVHRGIGQRRLVAVALGSGCLAGVIGAAGATAMIPSAAWVLKPLMDLAALGSALAYWVGLAPPRWLRRIWQGQEIQRFLIGLAGQSGGERVAAVLEYLGPAAARATGGKAAVIGLAPADARPVLDLHSDPATASLLERLDLAQLVVDQRTPVLDSVWRMRQGLAISSPDAMGSDLQRFAEALPAHGALIAPLATTRRTYGLFVVFIDRASPFAADDLSVLGMLADQAALAIEARQLVEEGARERSTLTAVMSSMHEGLVVMDEDEVVRYCNKRAAELLGIEQRLALGAATKSVLAHVRPRLVAADAVIGQWTRALRSPEQRPTLELELTEPSKSLQADVFTVADTTAGRLGVGVVLRDVTAERDLVRTKDELVSVVSHELRTPLASVVGFAELLRTRELNEAQRQQFLTVILEEGRRLTALINDFLDLQRMESGRQEIAPRPVEVTGFIEQCIAAAGEDAAHPIQLDLADDLPAVRADADRIQQVMTNLLSNARKYSPAGGEIRVAAHEANGQVIVSVQDHGLGLPPEALPRLFEKFYRVDNSDRRSITGTGLGLAISRKIVDAHGGRIWAESPGLGQGSSFVFSLPLADVRKTSGEVLIVEDDAGFARLLEAELTGRGLTSVWVPSAEEALQQLEVETPKALVLDLLLPRLQGEAFLRRLRQGSRAAVPVVVVSVKDLSQEERITMEQLGAVAMLRKEPAVGAAAADIIWATLRRSSVRDKQDLVA